jgi:hypothetical protein
MSTFNKHFLNDSHFLFVHLIFNKNDDLTQRLKKLRYCLIHREAIILDPIQALFQMRTFLTTFSGRIINQNAESLPRVVVL